MAASGATSIVLYNSGSTGATPLAGDLVHGELALNYADGKLFYKDATNTVQEISGGGGGSGTVTTVSVVSANGLAGTVANATTTPAITLTTSVTGILQGNGTAISAASTTGSGNVVLATSPTLVTPILGTPQSGDFSTGTFTWPTFNQNTTGSAGSVANSLTIGTGLSGTSYNGSAAVTIANTGVLTFDGGTTGLTPASATNGAVSLGGTLVVANGGTGATTASGARTNLGAAASGANSDITSLSGLTGAISSPTYIQYGNGSGTTLAAGRMWYDQTTGSLNFGMGGGNITQQVGEELFVYGKASAAISGNTLLQAIYKTGTVGASGVVQFAPTISGITDPGAIIGVATEDIANNGFGRITNFGVVHGVDTTGSTYGETWANNDDIWYNPVTGGLTHTKPSAPNMKFQIGTVINAGSGGSGTFQVFLQAGSTLGGTDSNVGFGTLNNNDLIQYSTGLGYWTNVSPSSITVGNVSGTVAIANGGTGQTTQQTAINALAGAVTSGQYLRGNGTNVVMSAIQAADVPTLNQNTTGSAGSVANALTIGTGLTGTSFNGSAAVTMNLANTAVTPGSYGSASSVATFTVDQQGRLTAAGSTAIAIANTAVSGLGTMSTQNANAVAITGGTMDGTTIGGTTPAAITGTTITGTTVTSTSDERLKYGWKKTCKSMLDALANVKSGTFKRRGLKDKFIGVSAQSLQEVMPEAVVEGEDGYLSVAYGNAALVAAIELAKEVKQLKLEIAELKAQLK